MILVRKKINEQINICNVHMFICWGTSRNVTTTSVVVEVGVQIDAEKGRSNVDRSLEIMEAEKEILKSKT